MKNFLKFAGLFSLILAAIGFVLMMFTPAVTVKVTNSTSIDFAGTLAIFGGDLDTAQALYLLTTKGKPVVLELFAWIFVMIAMIILLLGVILPLLKVKAMDRFAGLLNFIAIGLLAVGAVFMFIVLPTFYGTYEIKNVPSNASIGVGWVIGAILIIAAAVIALLPMAADFTSKGKKKKRK